MRHSSYKPIRNIGRGSFGRVDLVESETDGRHYVIKKLQVCQQNKEAIVREVTIMKNLRHQYVIGYFESYLDGNGNVCIVMEYAEQGELEQYLNQRRAANSPLSEDEVMEWFIQLCLGIKFIHDHRVLHRDLKCENIFITGQNELKIGDFGISKLMSETFQMAKTKIGTPYVMAPEIWESKKYNQKSDIWSLGCILYKMMMLTHAFESKNVGSYVSKITQGKYNPITGNYSPELKNLVKSMLSLQPENRPSVHSILQLDFIRRRLPDILDSTLRRYHDSTLPLLTQKPSQRLLSQKRSFSSLSNSSMLTPKSTTLNTTTQQSKLVEMKQSYPILVEEVKQLRRELDEERAAKEGFVGELRGVLEGLRGRGDLGALLGELEDRITRYQYP